MLELDWAPDCTLTANAREIMNRATRIGEAAKHTGLTIHAIRFYEKQNLLLRPARTAGRFRLHGGESVELMPFTRQARTLGFSLAAFQNTFLIDSHAPGPRKRSLKRNGATYEKTI